MEALHTVRFRCIKGESMMEHTELTVCGARGSWPMGGREYDLYGHDTTCFVLKRGKCAVIADCGTGMWVAQEEVRDCDEVDVLITHFHYDHIAGLLMARSLCERARFFVPDIEGAVQALLSLSREPYWPLPLGIAEQRIFPLASGASFTTCMGPARARRNRHPGTGLLYRVDTPEGGVCFLFDNDHGGDPIELCDFARGADTLVYDGMLTEDMYSAGRRGHSTAQAGALLAKEAGAKRLIVTHHAPYHNDAALNSMEAAAKPLFCCV